MIEALLCDIDGTLVDSNWLHAAAWKDAFEAMGIQLELEQVRRQIGKGGDQLIPVFVPWWKRGAVEKPLESYRKFIFHTQYFPQVKPLPRVREFLVGIQKLGIRLALASSASREDLRAYKRIAGMEDLINIETSADDAAKSKPHPDIFAATLQKLNVSPRNALALGDTPYDAEAAGKAGLFTVGVTSGGWTEAELLDAGCIEVYRDIADLLDHLPQSALMR